MKSFPGHRAGQMLNKVPQVTILFWLIKVMATTVGETGADFLNFNLHFGLTGTSLLIGAFLVVFLVMQLSASAYTPWLYWAVVVFISIAGTLITDNLVDNFGVALQTTTIMFAIALLATFAIWYFFDRTLSIHSIVTLRRELFYWAAILFTFALGTAAGDLIAEGMGMGYRTSALVFGSLIGVVAICFYLFKANSIAAFWIAYILTRPLGASCGDLLTQPVANGGLGLSTVGTSLLFLVGIASMVVYLTLDQRRHCSPVDSAQAVGSNE